jgi:hypothetical protein
MPILWLSRSFALLNPTNGDAMILKILERDKINGALPLFTLDVNQISLKQPTKLDPQYYGLPQLEWNYFQVPKVELCVTPETPTEITKGTNVESLGATAYNRFKKTELFKSRPAGTTLSLIDRQANTLWMGIKDILLPSVKNDQLTINQRADVSQLFFHTVAGSTMSNAAFITVDTDFLQKRRDLERELRITIFTPTEAWNEYKNSYNLYQPTDAEVIGLWHDQQSYYQQLRTSANSVITIARINYL